MPKLKKGDKAIVEKMLQPSKPFEDKYQGRGHLSEDEYHGPMDRYLAQQEAKSPLTKARGHLEKETERGDHSPKVGGHGTEQHGGRVPSNETSHSFANEPEDNLKGSKGSGYRE